MQLTGCDNANYVRNATCADTQYSIEWPYCTFPILCHCLRHRLTAKALGPRLHLVFMNEGRRSNSDSDTFYTATLVNFNSFPGIHFNNQAGVN